MDILSFNEAALIAKLSQLTAQRQSLFAALVATRLSVAYEIYAHHAGLPSQGFRMASDYLWRQIEREIPFNGIEVDAQIEIVMALIPDEDSSWTFTTQANDAIAALAYALGSIKNANPQEVAWTARRAYECVDNLVISREDVEIGGAAEERILQDPLIQTELARQHRDLETAAVSSLDSVVLLRHRDECLSWGVKFFQNHSGGN
jgi:hypothetical protein